MRRKKKSTAARGQSWPSWLSAAALWFFLSRSVFDNGTSWSKPLKHDVRIERAVLSIKKHNFLRIVGCTKLVILGNLIYLIPRKELILLLLYRDSWCWHAYWTCFRIWTVLTIVPDNRIETSKLICSGILQDHLSLCWCPTLHFTIVNIHLVHI